MLVFFALASLAGLVAALILPGLSDLVLLAGPCLLASLWLIWQRFWPKQQGRPKPAAPKSAPKTHVIVDGSNVMHWQDGTPSLVPVVSAVLALEARGHTVGVIFDANAGYKTHDRYQGDRAMARQLRLPEDRVLVVPKGTPADVYILEAARDLRARVVTNDRYRDWLETFPEAAEPGFLIRGGAAKNGEVWLNQGDLEAANPAKANSAAVRP